MSSISNKQAFIFNQFFGGRCSEKVRGIAFSVCLRFLTNEIDDA
jgi:hypothetical protein